MRKPSPGWTAISAVIFEVGVVVRLYPFVKLMLDYFGLAPLQLTPNSYQIIVEAYITCQVHNCSLLTAPMFAIAYSVKVSKKKG